MQKKTLVMNLAAGATLLALGYFSLPWLESSVGVAEAKTQYYHSNTIDQLVKSTTHSRAEVKAILRDPNKHAVVPVVVASIKEPNDKGLVFIINKKYIVFGNIMNAQGEVLNAHYAKAAGLTPKPISLANLWHYVKTAPGWTEGKATAPIVYEFVDPNCLFCQKTYVAEEPLIKAGKLRVKFIPVGFLKGNVSVVRAAELLESKDPAAKYNYNETHFNFKQEMGGIPLKNPALIPAKYLAEVHANTMALERTMYLATPTLVFKTSSHKIVVEHGAPGPKVDTADLNKFFAHSLGGYGK